MRIPLALAFGWLTVGGTLHFAIDVVSQIVRHKRAPGPETTLYYGINSAYALGQVVFGLAGLILTYEVARASTKWPVIALSLTATASWFLIAVLFLEYKEPRFVVALFGLLVIAAYVTG